MPLQHWLQLSLAEGVGPITIRRMVDFAGSAESAAALSEKDLRSVEGVGPARAQSIRRALDAAGGRVDRTMDLAARSGVRLLCLEDSDYPALLRSILDPPAVLYVRGCFEPRDLQALAIVGSRRCTHYGREQAERFGALLAAAGFTVVSGGARGIDVAAHRGALRHPQGRTVCVLGCGIDVVYPPENLELYGQIAARGAMVSELPFGTAPSAENFPRRNRIISGLSRGVLVVEADEHSGAMITARLAGEEQGRTVFAMPGRIDSPMSRGTHQLIRDGAILTAVLDDIVQGLGPVPEGARQLMLFDESAQPAPAAAPQESAAPAMTERQRRILEALDDEPTPVDRIIERTGVDASAVLGELTFLTLKGVVKRIDGQTFARRRRA